MIRRRLICAAALLAAVLVLAIEVQAAPPIVWQRYSGNPVLGPGAPGSWDSYNVVMGSVQRVGGTYHLWYYGSANNFNFQIGHATSADGIAWIRDATNPVVTAGPPGSWEERAASGPEVVYEDGLFKMWYSGLDNSATPGSIGYATSPDGSAWTKYAGNPVVTKGPSAWDSQNIVNGAVLHDSSGYRLWYSGSGDGLTYRSGLAFSQDGITWTKHSAGPVMDVGPAAWDSFRVHPSTILSSELGLVMFYIGSDGGTQRVGVALSTDGVVWTKYGGNPTLDVGMPGAWDSASLSRVDVELVGRQLWLWYSGNAAGADWQIGLATLRPGAAKALMRP